VSGRVLARRHGVSRRTVKSALASAVPPPRKPPVRSRQLVLTPVKALVDEMLRSDLSAPRKQRHTIERIYQRLAIEHDFTDASYSAVRNYVARRRPEILAEARAGHQHLQGMVPQVHAPGEEAEVDFCDAFAVIAGKSMRCYLFTLRLSFSGRAIHRLFASQGQEAFMEGHVEAFRALGGVPTRHIRYDNLKRHLVPPPEAASLAALNERLAEIETAEDAVRHVHGAPGSVAFTFAAEAPLLHPLPADDFEIGLTLTPLVRRNARIVVRQCYYSIPARFIDRKVRVSLRANEVVVFDGRQIVARHPRLSRRFDYHDDLDHYLEILLVKPGALAGSTALAQARADGTFTAVHDAFWATARASHGEAAGTRALIEVLLLHRQLPHQAVVAGITATITAGSCSPELVAIEARKAADGHPPLERAQPEPDASADAPDDTDDLDLLPSFDDSTARSGAQVISLHSRLLLTGGEHQPPPMSVYDQLLSRRSKGTTA